MEDQEDDLRGQEAGAAPRPRAEVQGRRGGRGRQQEGRQRLVARPLDDIDAVRDARKANKPVPAKLAEVAAKWDEFNSKDRDVKKTVAEPRRRSTRRSARWRAPSGDVDDVESLKGEVNEKQIELDLTIGGEVQPYVMTLRKYDLKRDNGQTGRGRWVIQNLQPMS